MKYLAVALVWVAYFAMITFLCIKISPWFIVLPILGVAPQTKIE
jgi:hypothetical protein